MAAPASTRPKILVVEDEEDVRAMVSRILGTFGEVTTARDGNEALTMLGAGPTPDVIVTDLMMPRMDGLSLAKELKKVPHLSRVPVVMLTARSRPGDMIEGINAGARSYVTKPFKADDLIAKVKKALGLAK
jgi:CheY-like chemotaxis protein